MAAVPHASILGRFRRVSTTIRNFSIVRPKIAESFGRPSTTRPSPTMHKFTERQTMFSKLVFQICPKNPRLG